MLAPARAFWPFVPRPAVLPLPAAMPRPTRVRSRREPAAGRRSCSFILDLFDAHQEADGVGHPPERGRIGDLDRLADSVQAERADRSPCALGVADGALDERNAQLIGHRPEPPLARSRWCRYPTSRPLAGR